MDNNANEKYDYLDKRIAETYLNRVDVTAKKSIYDSYVRAFRWASDRIGEDGIISFVSNGSYIDNLAFSGFRRELLKEFNHVYVYNLRGNQRTQGELSRKEGGKIFGSGSRNTICIIVLIKHHGQPFDGFIHYKDIGDYLSKEEKLRIVSDTKSIANIEWEHIYPDKDNDWINKKDFSFEKFPEIANKKKPQSTLFEGRYSLGISTAKDAWIYNFDEDLLKNNISAFIDYYNAELERIKPILAKGIYDTNTVKKLLNFDSKKITWSDDILQKLKRFEKINNDGEIVQVMYRPFVKTNMNYNKKIISRTFAIPSIYPSQNKKNLTIAISYPPLKQEFSCLITNGIVDCHMLGQTQMIPLYWYDESNAQGSLFDLIGTDESDNYSISDCALGKFNEKLGMNISKSDFLYYIYGVFHSNGYKSKYSKNLAKQFPRIPYVKNANEYIKQGKLLASLHLNYEMAPAYDKVKITKQNDNYKFTKIYFADKNNKSTIIFNNSIKIENIPLEVYNYKINGRSPIEWIMDQYQYSIDKDSKIINDPNKFKPEGGKYVFDLILSLITVSLETQKLIKELPEYKEI